MANDSEHRSKLTEIEEKQNKYFARRVEEHDAEQVNPSDGALEKEADAYADPGFATDFLCYECTPSEDDLAFTVGNYNAPTVTSKGGEWPREWLRVVWNSARFSDSRPRGGRFPSSQSIWSGRAVR